MFQNLSPSIIAEIVALLSAAILLYYQPKPWRNFIPFIALIVLVEFGGRFIKYELAVYSNQWLYNMLLPVYFPFYFWAFSFIPLLQPYKKSIRWGIFSFLLFALLNLLFIQGFQYFNGYTYITGSFLLIALSLWFYTRTIIYPGSQSLFTQPFFWMVSGVFIFQAGSMYLHFFQDTLQDYYKLTGTNFYTIIIQLLNVWLYAMLIISFFVQKFSLKK